MKRSHFWFVVGTLVVLIVSGLAAIHASDNGIESAMFANSVRFLPHPPALTYSIQRTAPVDVAKALGRSQGCADVDYDFIQDIAHAALVAHVDPSIFAALVATESGCNQYAVSSRGAVGITQIMVPVWRNQYDFAGKVNLFNREDNLRVGATILSALIQTYGLDAGLTRYNGLGVGADPNYTSKIEGLAGR